MYDITEIVLVDDEGEVVATADTLRGARTGVETLLREGHDVLAIDQGERRLFTAWLDDNGRTMWRTTDVTRRQREAA